MRVMRDGRVKLDYNEGSKFSKGDSAHAGTFMRPERIIVGWYHTHPGFGIFLSNMDAFIHENFFSFPWEPAYVFDPQAETDGFFFKVGTELVQEEVYIFGDVEPSVKDPMIGFAFPEKILMRPSMRPCVPLF